VPSHLAQGLELTVLFVECDVHAASQALGHRYEVVYTSQGFLCWLHDLDQWARVVADLQEPGGFFYIMGEQPYAVTLQETEVRPSPDERCLRQEDAQYDEADKTYQWTCSPADVVHALLRADLRLELLNEYPMTFYQRLSYMERTDQYWWTIPGYAIPLMFTVGARKA
jgi:hypothetical protein